MPNSDTLPLRIHAADAGTEIFLVNAEFRRVASAVGELRTDVKPGLYKVRFRSGEVMIDRLIEVPATLPGGPSEISVRGEPLPFASALPLPDTRTSHEYHQAAWDRAWDPPDIQFGSGSLLFVLARDVEKRPGTRARNVPWQGLALCRANGEILLDFADAPHQDADLGFASANIELDPGTYILRVDTRFEGILEMPVVTSPGWQTQVALRSHTRMRSTSAGRRKRSARRADLADATVLMVRPGYRTYPSERQDRLTELARIGLLQGRSTLRQEDLRSMLSGKFENPMLGIYGAHLLLEGDGNTKLLREVVENLERLLPCHSDVAALRLALAMRTGEPLPENIRFHNPPMLARSWRIAVDASLIDPQLIPSETLAARVASNLVNSPHWLIWRRSANLTRALREGTEVTGQLLAANLPDTISDEFIQHGADYLNSKTKRMSRQVRKIANALATKGLRILEQTTPEAIELLIKRVDARRASAAVRKLTPIQEAVLHELAATAHLDPLERVRRLARNLRLPPVSLYSILIALAKRSR